MATWVHRQWSRAGKGKNDRYESMLESRSVEGCMRLGSTEEVISQSQLEQAGRRRKSGKSNGREVGGLSD